MNAENVVAAYALAAIPARFALERGDWQQAAALKLLPANLAWSKFPQAEAILVFARGLGAARIGDVAAARRDAERLRSLREVMTAVKMDYWVAQTDVQIKAVNAWIALAEKRHHDAVAVMRAAAEAEDASDKHPVTPGNVAPCRQLLGEMLMTLDSPVQAFGEFERSLKRDPIASEAFSALPVLRKRLAIGRPLAHTMRSYRPLLATRVQNVQNSPRPTRL